VNINLNIKRLALDGLTVPQHHCPVLKAAFEAELAQLLATSGLSPSLQAGGAIYRVPADTIHLSNEIDPSNLGRQIALAVYGGIGH